MRITTLILITSLLQVSATGFGQKITIVNNNIMLSEVFKEIRKQTGYNVLWQPTQVNGTNRINLNIKNQDLRDALDLILNNRGLTYSIEEETVMIKVKTPSFLERVVDRWAAIDVHGRVVDSENRPLSGATVKVKSTGKSVSTNGKGEFYLEKVEEDVVLMVSFIGYVGKEVVAKRNMGDVVLEQSLSKLDEVQVMAYGTTTRRLSTGNITSIRAEEIAEQPSDNPLYALQGRVPGLIITPTTGMSGGATEIQIRGRNTLRIDAGGSDPLVVVDGLPMLNNIPGLDGGTLGLSQLSSISFINPNDIESIEVLKDADATSIYGSRGANGVILITRKKGITDGSKVSINVQSGWAEVAKRIDLMSTDEYLKFRKQAYVNAGLVLGNLTTSPSRADVKLWDQNKYTDWQDVLLGNTAKYNDVQGSITGGTTNLQYIIGGTYHRQTTVFPGNNSDAKGNAYFSLTGTSKNQKLKTTVAGSVLSNVNTYPIIDFTAKALTLPPNAPDLYTVDGLLNFQPLPSGNSSWDNPITSIKRTYESNIKNLVTSGNVVYNPIKDLNIKTQFGYSVLNGKSFRENFLRATAPPEGANEVIASIFATNEMENVSVEPQLDYTTRVGKGKLNLLLGGAWQYSALDNQNISANGFSSDALVKSLAAASFYRIDNAQSEYKYIAGFARLNYNYQNKYIINLNARRDGSSRFGPGRRFGNFGSIGAAWILSDENFFTDLRTVVSFCKLRVSYGAAGNDGIGDYGYYERYHALNTDVPYQGVRAYATNGLYNPYFGWEKTKKFEIGLETAFLKDRLIFNPSVYVNRSNNQLLEFPSPSISGPGSPLYNLPAEISNYGLEFTLESVNVKSNNFSWTTSVNLSAARNKLISYPGLDQSPYYRIFEVGQPFYGVVRAFKSAGVDPVKGQFQFYDITGKVTLDPQDASRLDNGAYLRIMTSPKYYGGISNTVTCHNFGVSFFIQFTKQMGLNPLVNYIGNSGFIGNLPKEFADSWKQNGDKSNLQKAVPVIKPELRNASDFAYNSDFAYVDASFIRLKNFNINYKLPVKDLKINGVQEVKLFVQGQNLFTITKYKGLDPETQSMTSIPPLRTIVAGINIIF